MLLKDYNLYIPVIYNIQRCWEKYDSAVYDATIKLISRLNISKNIPAHASQLLRTHLQTRSGKYFIFLLQSGTTAKQESNR